jgi:two-component system, chemotaxis family, sensor kinase CheA
VSEDQDFLKELQKEFLDELQFLLEACEESYLKIENPDVRVEELAKIFRLAHSIKGAGAAVGFTDLAGFAHVVEDCLAILRATPELVDTATISILLKSGDAIKSRIELLRSDNPAPWDIDPLKAEVKAFTALLEQRKSELSGEEVSAPPAPPAPSGAVVSNATASNVSARTAEDVPAPVPKPEEAHAPAAKVESYAIKVDSGRVESILNIVGELVVIKSQIINESFKTPGNTRLNTVVSLLDKTIRELQDRTLGMRMTPLKSLFLKTQRVARDLSVRLKKPIDFVLVGEDIEIDRNMVEQLSDPLVHLIRNCIDHGIELPAARKEKGKSEKGLITLSAQQLGGRVVIRISDDGNGINRDRIVKKAKEVGLLPETADVATMPDAAVFDLLFAPGFSTAEKVTDISGRGVGMNVVKENLEALKGRIDVESTFGKGSTFKISVPLTTSITDGMLISVDGQVYILPMDGIRELVDLREAGLVKVHSGDQLLSVRGRFFPLVKLNRKLRSLYHEIDAKPVDQKGNKDMVVLYEHEKGMVALEVDAVLGQTQVVMKPLGNGVKEGEGVAGAAILGDGKVALLLDVNTMIPDLSSLAA